MSEDINSMVQKATDLVNAENYSEALEKARSILGIDANNGDAKLIEAICLSKLGSARDASEAFAAAIRLDPTSGKSRFNAAVHEFNSGNIGQAKILATEAISLDPNHEGTKTLLKKISEAQPKLQDQGSYQREQVSEFAPENEGIAFVKSLGKGWLVLGAIISVLSLTVMILSAIQLFAHPTDISAVLNGGTSDQALKSAMGGTNIMLLLFDVILRVFAIAWMVTDMIHRKGTFLWLIGHIPCSCVGLGFITLPSYMIFGRK